MQVQTGTHPMFQPSAAPAAAGSNLSRDFTDREFAAMREVTAKGGLHVGFLYEQVEVKSRDPERNGTYQTRLVVVKQPKGDRATVSRRYITPDLARKLYPFEFSHFEQYQEAPTTGTPLRELPGLSQSQIGLLTMHGLRSVEDLVGVSEDQVDVIGLQASRARKVAVKWMESKTGNTAMIDAADVEARYEAARKNDLDRYKALEEEMQRLRAENAALSKLKADMTGQPVAAMNPDKPVAVERDDDVPDLDPDEPDPLTAGPAIVMDTDPLA